MSELNAESRPPIRILMVTPFPERSDRIVGGVAGVAYYLCQHLSSFKSVDVDVLVPACAIEAPFKKRLSGLDVTYLPSARSSLFDRLMLNGDAKKVKEYIDGGHYDLVHVQAAPEWARFLTHPVVVTLHGIVEQDMLFRDNGSLLRKLAWPLIRIREQIKRSRISNLILISPYVSRAIGSVYKGRSWNIENPVNEDYFAIEPKPKEHELLFAGVVSPRKNVERLIQALALVRERIPNISLRIAGSLDNQAYVKRCKEQVEVLGLQDNVEFVGSISLHEMQARLKVTKLMVLCSLQETAPLSIAEAMAAGVPVIASNICGIPHMVEVGVTGYLVDPTEIDDIAHGILEGLELDSYKAAERSKELARGRFAANVVAENTVDVYKNILKYIE